MTRETKPLIHFEQLEPRIMLSGDSLLNIAPYPDQDTVLDNPLKLVQEAELLDINDHVHEQIDQELLTSEMRTNNDVYKPIRTLFLGDNNDRDKSVDKDLNIVDCNPVHIADVLAVVSSSPEGVLESKVVETQVGGMPTYENDADLSKEYNTSIEIRGPPVNEPVTLPGMYLLGPTVNCFEGQIVYLDFDGAKDVTYDGPVVVEGMNIPELSAETVGLAGQEQQIIVGVLEALELRFEGISVQFTTSIPEADNLYSTIYIGGDDSAFGNNGRFLGLAEQVDVGNQDACDKAFVFSESIISNHNNLTSLTTALVDVIAHETGHLLGYSHDYKDSSGLLSSVALVESVSLADNTAWDGLSEIVLLGDNGISIDKDVTINDGFVASNDDIWIDKYSQTQGILVNDRLNVGKSSTILDDIIVNGAVIIDKDVTVDGDIDGGTVVIGRDAFIDGQVTGAGYIVQRSGSTVTGGIVPFGSPEVFSPILLPSASIFETDPDNDVHTHKNETTTLVPGKYGDLHLGVDSTLSLSSGQYFFDRILSAGGLDVNLDFTSGRVEIYVLGDVNLGKDLDVFVNNVAMTDANPALAAGVFIETHGQWQLHKDGQWFGTVFTPNDDIVLHKNCTLIGAAYSGSVVRIKKDSTIDFVPMDTTPPIIEGDLANDTGRLDLPDSWNDYITSDPTIIGTITDNSPLGSVLVTLEPLYTSPIEVINDPAIQPDGSFVFDWSFYERLLANPLTDGYYTLKIQAEDIFDNTSDIFELSFTLDTTPPVVTTPDLQSASDSGISDNDNLTNITTPSIDVDTEAGAMVRLLIDGVEVDQSTLGPLYTFTLAQLTDGSYIITATGEDIAGNIGTSGSLTIQIDTTAPIVTVDTLLTNDNTPELTGIVDDPDALINVTVAGNSYSATNNTNGTWTLADNTISPALADGTHDVIVSATDLAGNSGTDATFDELTIDTIAPVVTVDTLLTNDDTPQLTGTVDDSDASLEVTVNGSTYTLVNNGNGTWTLADVTISPAMADGTYDIVVTATDLAGNVGTDTTVDELIVDTTAPVVTVDTLLTYDNTPELTGTVDDPGAIIEITVGSNTYNGVNNGNGTWTLLDDTITPPLADGVYDVSVSSTDLAGNIGADGTLDELIIDTTPPVVDFNLATSTDSDPIGDYRTIVDVVILEGNTESNIPVSLFHTSDLSSPIATTTSDSNGSFAFNDITLVLGDNPLTVMATDPAGNVGTSEHTIVCEQAYVAYLIEGTNFKVTYEQTITVPNSPSFLSFTYSNLLFDTSDNFINDAFEAALIDNDGNSLVHKVADRRDAFFNVTEGLSTEIGINTVVHGQTVNVDLSHIPGGTDAKLVIRLVNNDADTRTSVYITDVSIGSGTLGTPVGTTFAVTAITSADVIDFALLSDVTVSVEAEYGHTSFNEDSDFLYADLQLRNIGTYVIDAPLIVVVDHLSDPDVHVVDADGVTPSGQPYFDFSGLIADGTLDPSELSDSRDIVFYNPNGIQFTYDLMVMGMLNHSPEFISDPDVEALAGRPYSYDAEAVDLDGDTLVYSLLSAPQAMTIDPSTGLINWQPSTVETGNHDVLVHVEDGRGGSDDQVYTLSVLDNVPNRPPVFTSIPVVDANVNTPYNYGADANDPDGDTLTFALINGPSGMNIDPTNGLVQWTPAGQQIGQHDVDIQVIDGQGGMATQTFVVEVHPNPENHPPVIISDPVESATIGQDYVYDVEAIDPDAGDVLTFSLGEAPAGMTIDGVTGLIEWTPQNTAVNPMPFGSNFYEFVEVADPYTGSNNSWATASAAASARVYNGLSGHLATITSQEENDFLFGLVSGRFWGFNGAWLGGKAPNGWLVGPETGQGFSYTNWGGIEPNNAGYAYMNIGTFTSGIAPGQWADDSGVQGVPDAGPDPVIGYFVEYEGGTAVSDVTVRVTDTGGLFDIQSFVLNVRGPGSAEIHGRKTNTNDGNGLENFIIYIDANGNTIRDLDERFAVTDVNGNYKLTGLGADTYIIREDVPSGWIQTFPAAGMHEVTIADGQIVSGIDFVNQPAVDNRSPEFVSVPPTVAPVGIVCRYDATAVDVNGDRLTFDLPVGPDGMAVSPLGVMVWLPQPDQIGTHDVILRVRDDQGGVDLQVFQLTVTTNSTPVITSQPVGPAVVNVPYQYNITAQDADEDSLTFGILTGPTGMAVDADTGVLRWTPSAPDVGDHLISVGVSDGRGGQSTQSFTLPVVPSGGVINDPPSITSMPRTVIGLGDRYVYRVEATDPNSDPLTFGFDQWPSGMTLDTDGLILWTPAPEQFGDHSVIIRVEDGRGGFATQSFVLSVVQQTANTAPRIVSVPSFSAIVAELYEYNAVAEDAEYDLVVWSLVSAPDNVSIDAMLGTLRWTPTAQQIGFHQIVVQATDAQGASAQQGFGVNVRSVNTPSNFTSVPPTEAFVDYPYSYAVRVEDINGDNLSFSLVTAPQGMTIGEATGLVEWTPSTVQVGMHDVTIIVDDGRGGVGQQNYQLSVVSESPNEPPTITSKPEFAATIGQTYQYQIVANDPEGFSLTYELITGPVAMDVDSATGLVTWTPTADQVGPNAVQVAAFDPFALGASQTFTITVRADNGAPVLNNTPRTTTLAGKLYAFDMNVTDPDGDEILYTLTENPGDMAVDPFGRLTWTPTLADVGVHRVGLIIQDELGAGITFGYDLTVITDTTPPQVILEASANPVDPGQPITVTVSATDNVAIKSVGLMVDGTPMPLDGNGRVVLSFNTFGTVTLVANATDTSSNTTTSSLDIRVIDTSDIDAPVVEIISPAFGDEITTFTDIIGTVSDDNLVGYSLTVRPLNGGPETKMATGTSVVFDSLLGLFDPSIIPNGSYLLKLQATDLGGNVSTVLTRVDISGTLKIGQFAVSFTDVSVPLPGFDLEVTRGYNSVDRNRSQNFGFGWHLEFARTDLETNVQSSGLEQIDIYNPFFDGTRVYVTLPSGKREVFAFLPEARPLLFETIYQPRFIAAPGNISTLTVDMNHADLRRLADGTYVSWVGNIPYNPASDFFGGDYILTTRRGNQYLIDGDTGDLKTLTDRNGNTLTFSRGGIISSTGKSITFNRDAQGRITTLTDPLGNSVNYEYDAAGDLVRVTDRGGNVIQFVYDQSHFLVNIVSPEGSTVVTSQFDEKGRIIAQTDADGNRTEFDYDNDNRRETIADPDGNVTIYEYDSIGNVTAITDALGNSETYTYDGDGNLLTQTDRLGNTTTYTYDSHSNQTSSTTPTGVTVRTTFGEFGDILSITNGLGHTTTVDYDGRGNPSAITDPLGGVCTYAYDSFGNLLRETDPLGNATVFEYNIFGDIEKVTNPLGHSTTFTYDANGNQLTTTTTRTLLDGTLLPVSSRTEFDTLDRPTSFTDFNGVTTTSRYTSSGKYNEITDGIGNTVRIEYDPRGQATDLEFADGGSARIEYDARGQDVEHVDSAGRSTRFEYDELGRLVRQTSPLGAEIAGEYDDAGRLTSVMSPLGYTTQLSHDAFGLLIGETDPLGNVISYEYDAAYNVTDVIDQRGNRTNVEYDALARSVRTTMADGSVLTNEYDALGRVIAQTDALGRMTRFEYDAIGNITSLTDAAGNVTRYEYDEFGNMLRLTDAEGRETTFEYDNCGRLVRKTLPMGQSTSSTYDDLGNLVSTTDYNGNMISITYDDFGIPIAVDFTNGDDVTRTYHDSGLVASITDSRGTTVFEYDDDDRPTLQTDPDGRTVAYTYDLAGNRLSVTTGAGTTSYTYDLIGRLLTVTDPDGGLTTYTYDETGNIVTVTKPDGTISAQTYDVNNRLTRIELRDSTNGLLSSYDYLYDAVGNMVSVVENTGRTVVYEYDVLDRLVEERIHDPNHIDETISYTYDAVGNRLTRTDSNGTIHYSYDDNDRLLSDGRFSYTYDDNGNLTSKVGGNETVTHEYDDQNQLVRVTVSNGVDSNVLDFKYVAGIRVQKVINGSEEINYLIDFAAPVDTVLAEFDGNGALLVDYVYGIGLISQNRDGHTHYYHHDATMSVRQLTDAVGVVVASYTYDAFGQLRNTVGGAENTFLFVGEQFDGGTGLYNFRARYLDPSNGRFVGRDILGGLPHRPATFNPYTYVENNPLTKFDPTGRLTLTQVSITAGIIGGLAALNAVAIDTGIHPFLFNRPLESTENFDTSKYGSFNGTWLQTYSSADISSGSATGSYQMTISGAQGAPVAVVHHEAVFAFDLVSFFGGGGGLLSSIGDIFQGARQIAETLPTAALYMLAFPVGAEVLVFATLVAEDIVETKMGEQPGLFRPQIGFSAGIGIVLNSRDSSQLSGLAVGASVGGSKGVGMVGVGFTSGVDFGFNVGREFPMIWPHYGYTFSFSLEASFGAVKQGVNSSFSLIVYAAFPRPRLDLL